MAGFFKVIVKIGKKGRIQKISAGNLIVHNLLITSDLPKIVNKKSPVVKLLDSEP